MGYNIQPSTWFDAFAPIIKRKEGRQQSRRSLRLRFHLTLLSIDLACLIGSFQLAYWLYPVDNRQLVTINVFVTLGYTLAAITKNAYSVSISNNILGGIGRSVNSLITASSGVLFAAFMLKMTDHFSRAIFCLGFVIAIILLVIARYLFLTRSKAVIRGTPYDLGLITDKPADANPAEFTKIVDASKFDPSLDSPRMYHNLAMALRNLDRVIVDCPAEQRQAWSHALKGANVSAEILAPELGMITQLGFDQYHKVPTIVVARGPLGLYDRFTKRAFDLAIALFCIVLFAPLLAIVMLAIRLETPGSVFFVQERIGRSNRIFKVFKFRSMTVEQSDSSGSHSAQRIDNRITKVGRIIRALSIDELPQLLNVLYGDMSIVGPRPHALGSRAEGKLFWEIDPRYWHRHATKPGLTGLAQVRGYRGSTMRREDLINRLAADLEYVQAWSLWLDTKIVLKTFGVIIHPNAF